MNTQLNWKYSDRFCSWFLIIFLLLLSVEINANDIIVKNVRLTGQVNGSHTFINFDLNWKNSWRNSTNWDAAWLFVKYKIGSGEWLHATLSTTVIDHTIPSGSAITPATDGKGAFIYRDAEGTGENNFTEILLRWNYFNDGVANDAQITVKVFAIEMVYIPQGGFSLGDGASDSTFHIDGDPSTPFVVSSEGAITLNDTSVFNPNAANLWAVGAFRLGSGTLPAEFPKGYDAFYMMKYEITQGQYVEFLNMLNSTQLLERYTPGITEDRYTINGTHPFLKATRPARACNYLAYTDGAAYADWTALRPMTELEYEKSCRGTASVVAGEFAWGTTFFDLSGNVSGVEDGTETVTDGLNLNANGSVIFSNGDGGTGPLRSGIFAATTNTREGSGGSFYGVMELSGNLFETTITADSLGRGFQGTHGDGQLSPGGYANNTDWPGYSGISVIDTKGSGGRGGGWNQSVGLNVSSRIFASSDAFRTGGNGFRCVRSVE